MSEMTKEGYPGKGGNVRIGKLADRLTDEQKKQVEQRVAGVKKALAELAGPSYRRYPERYGEVPTKYEEEFRAHNLRAQISGRETQVRYQRDETGRELSQTVNGTNDIDTVTTREVLEMRVDPDSDKETVFKFDFLGDPIDEVSVLAVGVSDANLSEDQKVNVVLGMLEDAAGSLYK
ncbi:MAG TPA: hypothetical protein VFX86_00245 [Candidatus Saccharimonadales bacterium]|nr:hypothetical protein [Candidatus Saccharimonadales bacterium]